MTWINPTLTFLIQWALLLLLALGLWKAAWWWKPVDLVFAAPMWLFTRAVVSLNKNHPWYGRRFALDDWRRNRTILTRQCDLLAWATLTCVPIALYRLLSC